ncbi:MAG: hypothetical protein JW804_06620 [Sedimentisphaerales bacterium]|nr:hypothetical protein [Sedimentisphaerales bacterium]
MCFYAVFDTWNYEQAAYNDSINDYVDIALFWSTWEADGWVDKKHEIVKTLLNQHKISFVSDDNRITEVYRWKLFPGVNKDMLDTPLNVLNKEARAAKELAIENAKKRFEKHEYWGTKSTIEAEFIGIAAALGGAVLGFLGTWVIGLSIYKFFEWLILGFRDDKRDQIEKAEPEPSH